MFFILILSIVIIFAIILVTAVTTTKAYKFKHTIDPLPSNEDSQKAEKATSKI